MKATIQFYNEVKNEIGVMQAITDTALKVIRAAHELKLDSLVYQHTAFRVETKGDKSK